MAILKCRYCPQIRVAHGRGAAVNPMICDACKRKMRAQRVDIVEINIRKRTLIRSIFKRDGTKPT